MSMGLVGLKKVLKMFLAIYLMLTIYCTSADCSNLKYPSNLWKGIVAEGASQGYRGMFAIACVYRNRLAKGMKLGCVGLMRKDLDRFVSQQGVKVSLWAQQAVLQVFEKGSADITNGATHYENLQFGKPKWFKDMIITQVIGNHTFMKERK